MHYGMYLQLLVFLLKLILLELKQYDEDHLMFQPDDVPLHYAKTVR